VAAPGLVKPTPSRLWLALLLFVLTIASTMFAGGTQEGPDGGLVWNWVHGILFSGTLLSILLAHEMGHFLASRRLGVAVSYPFFIPVPPPFIFGTMGAFIQMKEPPPDRRALFTIAAAGPLAGLVLAIPLTVIGLLLSTVEPLPPNNYILEGNNLLYAGLKWLVFQQWLPGNGMDVMLHPMAFAGWAGMLVTALNLLPAGQLDGGHIIYGLLGKKWGRRVTYIVIGLLLLLGFVWDGWWLWAVLIFFLAGRQAPVRNDVTPLGPRQRLLGILTIIIFVLLFTPLPLIVVQ
jgi:membrane-associated protease RseP (regulator of RpoE activity)